MKRRYLLKSPAMLPLWPRLHALALPSFGMVRRVATELKAWTEDDE